MIEPGEPEPESRFTAPTVYCPYPERWTSTDVDSTEREVADLVYGLVRGLQPDAVLECGTGFGEVAIKIAGALEQNGRGKLWTIEADAERVAYVRENYPAYPLIYEVVYGDTLTWEPPEGVTFDLCWFDSYWLNRVPEFHRYRPFMRPGTICCFHDTAPGHGADPAVPGTDIRSTISAALRPQLRMIHLPTPRGLTLAEVLP